MPPLGPLKLNKRPGRLLDCIYVLMHLAHLAFATEMELKAPRRAWHQTLWVR